MYSNYSEGSSTWPPLNFSKLFFFTYFHLLSNKVTDHKVSGELMCDHHQTFWFSDNQGWPIHLNIEGILAVCAVNKHRLVAAVWDWRTRSGDAAVTDSCVGQTWTHLGRTCTAWHLLTQLSHLSLWEAVSQAVKLQCSISYSRRNEWPAAAEHSGLSGSRSTCVFIFVFCIVFPF